MGFLDVYNIFNTNSAQTLTTSSGLLVAANRDHGASSPPDRRPIGMVTLAVPALTQGR